MTLKSFVTTVATPRKNVGRDAPSILEPKSPTWTKVLVGLGDVSEVGEEEGYISEIVGANTSKGDVVMEERAERSAGRVRG